MDADELRRRTKALAVSVINFVENLPRGRSLDVIGKQLIRSATSVAANYRAACRSRSRADFINKIGIVEEEADECSYWLDMLVDANVMKKERLADLMTEAHEITAMVVASIRTARRRS